MLYQTWNRTPVYFKLAVSASYIFWTTRWIARVVKYDIWYLAACRLGHLSIFWRPPLHISIRGSPGPHQNSKSSFSKKLPPSSALKLFASPTTLLWIGKAWALISQGKKEGKIYPARAGSARARRTCTLRALGLLLADGTPTVGGGKTFWRVRRIFYGNSCNSGTQSQKIVPKVGN